MRKEIIIGGALVGLLAAGVVSAAQLNVSGVGENTLAAGDVTVSGAQLTDVAFVLDGQNLDKVTLTLKNADGTAALAQANVAVTIGSHTATATTDDAGIATVDVVNVPVEDVESIKIVAAS